MDTLTTRFHELHARPALFVMPNAWDVGSARLLEAMGFPAIATTSQGHAWSIGTLDQRVSRDELVAHVATLAAATSLPLSVDSEGCFPNDPGGVARTASLLADAGAAGFSIEDWDPVAGRVDGIERAVERVAEASGAARGLVVTARCENHLYGIDDLDDTIARLLAYRDAGADAVYAPGLTDLGQIRQVVEAVGVPVNVLALPDGPSTGELERAGVRRVSTGSLLAGAAYAALVTGAQELLGPGTSGYALHRVPRALLASAFERP